MNREGKSQHPDLETLIAFSESRLPRADEAELEKHLESCVMCRLEIKKFQHFDSLGDDPIADEEAGWDQAQLDLDQVWHEEIQPTLQQKDLPGAGFRRQRSLKRAIWVIPAAAAAMAAFFMLNPGSGPNTLPLMADSTVVRGAEAPVAPTIHLTNPVGELDSIPVVFAWETEVACDRFSLEIFTASLETVVSEREITSSPWTLPSPEAELLKPGNVYLWKVRGYKTLEAVAESENQWFSVP